MPNTKLTCSSAWLNINGLEVVVFNDMFEYKGRIFRLDVTHDDCSGAPWENSGDRLVSDWVRRSKHPGERLLCKDRGSSRYYDFQKAMRIAKIEGWDGEPRCVGTRGERALRAVIADYEYLRKWCDGQWFYAVLHITLLEEDKDGDLVKTAYESYVGGVDYDYTRNGFWKICADEMADELIQQFERDEEERRISNRFRDAMVCGV